MAKVSLLSCVINCWCIDIYQDTFSLTCSLKKDTYHIDYVKLNVFKHEPRQSLHFYRSPFFVSVLSCIVAQCDEYLSAH